MWNCSISAVMSGIIQWLSGRLLISQIILSGNLLLLKGCQFDHFVQVENKNGIKSFPWWYSWDIWREISSANTWELCPLGKP